MVPVGGARGQDRREPSLSGVLAERLSVLLFSGSIDEPVCPLFVRPRRVWPRERISHTQGQNSILGASGGEWLWGLAGEWESACAVCHGSRHVLFVGAQVGTLEPERVNVQGAHMVTMPLPDSGRM